MRDESVLVGVPQETYPGEARVALVPGVLPQLRKDGIRAVIQRGAGEAAGFPDEQFADHGARLGSRDEVFEADIVAQVRTCGANPSAGRDDVDRMRPDQVVVGFADPLLCSIGVLQAAEAKAITFAMDFVPRITRAQSMDALSSQSTIVGYKAVLVAAERLPKMFPMLTTAAGTVAPAQVFIVGAGVAGLQAIATARRLGAVVHAYDVRPAAQEDIESLGARAVLLSLGPGDAEGPSGYAKELGPEFYHRQQELMATVAAGSDVVVTTAQIPGKRAPMLVTERAVAGMKLGSVIVDLAAEHGGNCELTKPNRRVITENRVTILGPTNLASTGPYQASQLYARNVTSFLQHIVHDGTLAIDEDDEIVKAMLVTQGGDVVSKRVVEALEEVKER